MCNAFRARRKQSFLNGKIEKPAEDALEIEDGQIVAAYFGRLKILWDELSNYVQPLVCSCSNWTYPLLSQSRAYALVVQEERHQTITRTRDVRVEAVSFAIQAPKAQQGAAASFSNNANGEKSVRKHCGKTGHEISSCFKIIGYLEWWTANHGKGNLGGRGQTNNSTGRSKSHAVVANAALMPASGGGNQASPTLSAQDRAALAATLTDDQWATMVNMLNSQNKDVSKEKLSGKWILDTGASRHMTGSRELMTDLQNIGPSPIGLPNGTCSHAQGEGTVEFGNNLRLNHVLYDRTMRTLIDVGEQEDGVYIFRSPASVKACRVSAEGNYYLWHRRLGHASNKIISLPPSDTFPYHDISLVSSPAHDPCVTHDSLRVQHVESPLSSLGSNRDVSSNDAQEELKSNDRGSPSSPHAVSDFSSDLAALHDRGSSSSDVSLYLPSFADKNIGISVRQSTRPKIPNTHLHDFMCHTARVIDPAFLSPTPPLSSGTPYPIAKFVTCANFSTNQSRFLEAITTLTEPTSIGLWLSLVVN
ncbi:retrovirus-related pol polyprotein from transposon RE1 [Citrus sinensis]|uniref:Retrovirus-related pol polyprotein from transposon RE1 n=1 Tax=Citrus sinensis TaxID=2711 RepID=A0ACB8JM91_CITSI|nr:retrovirus-related pol polyprotein from transposon RE1 [Citrus sinensis]